MAAGNVGSVSISVLPDLDKFKTKLAKALRKLEKQDRYQFHARVVLDKASLKKVKTQLAQALDDMDISLGIDVDRTQMMGAKRDVENTLDSISAFIDKIDVNDARIRELHYRIESELDDIRAHVDSLHVDTSGFDDVAKTLQRDLDRVSLHITNLEVERRALERVKRQLDDALKDADIDRESVIVPIEARLEEIYLDKTALERARHQLNDEFDDLEATVHADADTKTATLKLEWLTRLRTVTIEAVLKGQEKVAAQLAALSGLRAIDDMGDDIRDLVRDIDRFASKAAYLTTALGAVGSVALTAGGGLVNLAVGLAQTAQAGLVLPAMLSSTVAVVGAFAMAITDLNTVLGDLKPRFTALQDVVSASFWAQAEAPIRRLVDTTLPMVTQKMAEIGAASGAMAASVADAVAHSAMLGHLGEMLDNAKQATLDATDGMHDMVVALGEIGAVGSRYLPKLARWFTTISKRFRTFISDAAASGELEEWINDGIKGLKLLGSVVKNTTRTFTGLYKATAHSGHGLEGFAKVMQSIADTVNSSGFINGLSTILDGAAAATSRIGDGLYRVGQAIGSMSGELSLMLQMFGVAAKEMLTGIGDLLASPQLQSGLVQMMAGFATMVSTIGQTLPQLSPLFSSFAQLVGTVAVNVGNALSSAFLTLQPVLVEVMDALTPFVDKLGTALVDVLDWLRPKMEALAPVIGDVLSDAFTKAGNAVQQLTDAITGIDTAKIDSLKLQLVSLVGVAGAIVVAFAAVKGALALGGVAASVTEAVTAFGSLSTMLSGVSAGALATVGVVGGIAAVLLGAYAASESFRESLGGFFASFAPLAQPVKDILATVGSILWDVFEVVGNMLAPAVDGLTVVVQPLVQIISDLVTTILPPLQAAWEAILPVLQIIGDIVGGVLNVAFTILGGILQTIWAILEPVVSLFADILTPAFQVLSDLMNGTVIPAWESFKTTLAEAWENIKAKVSEAIGNIREKITTKVTEIKEKWAEKWNEIKQYFSDKWAEIKQTAADKVEEIKTKLATTWDNIKAKVVTIWTQVKQTIVDKITTIIADIKALPSKAASALSDFGSRLKNIATNAWASFKSAVSSGISNAIAQVRGLPGKIVGALGNVGSMLFSSGQSILRGLWNGISSMVGWVKGKISGALSSIRNLFPFSPAKEGPFSGHGWVLYSGMSIAEAMGDGITKASPATLSAASRLASLTSDALTLEPPQLGVDAMVAPTSSGSGGGGDQYTINVTILAQQLRDIDTITQFIDMLGVYQKMGVAS